MSAKKTALALEAQHKTMSGFSEEIIKSQFQTVPLNVLKIVRIGVASTYRGDILSEWPMRDNTEFNKQCLEVWEGL